MNFDQYFSLYINNKQKYMYKYVYTEIEQEISYHY